MALAICHWALACGIIEENGSRVGATELGQSLFGGERPWDPYMERPATAWLVQWQVAGDPKMTTTWYWAFNHLAAQTFDHDALSTSILQYARARQWSRIAEKTVTRDVECFIRSYVPRADKAAGEDALEPVLAELGLIRPVAGRLYEFRRGPKPSLPDWRLRLRAERVLEPARSSHGHPFRGGYRLRTRFARARLQTRRELRCRASHRNGRRDARPSCLVGHGGRASGSSR